MVEYLTTDMYKQYIDLLKKVFQNTSIVVDLLKYDYTNIIVEGKIT